MEQKQTAVEYVVEKLEKFIPSGNQIAIDVILEKVKEMEKQQVKEFNLKQIKMETSEIKQLKKQIEYLENDLELADKKVITSSFWYFAQGLILGAIIMYLLIN